MDPTGLVETFFSRFSSPLGGCPELLPMKWPWQNKWPG